MQCEVVTERDVEMVLWSGLHCNLGPDSTVLIGLPTLLSQQPRPPAIQASSLPWWWGTRCRGPPLDTTF